jgi:hypothetical protein
VRAAAVFSWLEKEGRKEKAFWAGRSLVVK